MICHACGKPEGTLKEEIEHLHSKGLTPAEIRDELVRQGWRKKPKHGLIMIHYYLRHYLGVQPKR